METIPPAGSSVRSQAPWPNMIVFPRELRDAIPEYGSRALVFDSVTESPHNGPVAISGMPDEALAAPAPRVQFRLLVHETGALGGRFTLLADLDAETTRALGRFLLELADRSEAGSPGGE